MELDPSTLMGMDWATIIKLVASTAVITLVTQYLNQRTHKKVEKVVEMAEQIEEQVTNNHTTNLRDDFDRVEAKFDKLNENLEALTDVVLTLAAGEEPTRQQRRRVK